MRKFNYLLSSTAKPNDKAARGLNRTDAILVKKIFSWHTKLLPKVIHCNHSESKQSAVLIFQEANPRTYYSHNSVYREVFHTQKTWSSKNSSWLFDTYLCI